MPIIPGASSGIDTDKIIKDLKEVEKQPIKRLEKQKKEVDLEIKVLQELQKMTSDLQKEARSLYGFEANYETKKFISENSAAIKGTASKKAEEGEYNIEIMSLASKLTIGSKDLKPDEEIPKGSITLNGKKMSFSGGTLSDFRKFLNKNYSDILSAKKFRISSKSERLVIASQQEGEKGVFSIDDPDKLLKYLGIYDPTAAKSRKKEKASEETARPQEEFAPVLFEPNRMGILSDGPGQVSPDQRSLTLDEEAARELRVSPPVKENAKLRYLNLGVDHKSPSPEIDKTPTRLSFGPTRSLNIKGIILKTYNADRKRKRSEPAPHKFDWGIILKSKTGKSQKRSLKNKGSLQQIPIPEDITSLGFYTQNIKVTFGEPNWVYEVEPPLSSEKTKKTAEGGKADMVSAQKNIFPHLIRPGKNLKLRVDGIKMERHSNTGIDDIIEGVQLDLLKDTDAPVRVSISGDHEDIKKQILLFVESYNKLLEFSQENSKVDELANDVGKFDAMAKLKGKTGILIANTAVRNLINGLKTKVANPYPALREPRIKVLAALGITTGEIGASWEEISRGYLQVDETLLTKYLTESPLAVKEFFGSDTNYDLKVDNGLALKIYEFLKPYTQNYGNGIIYSNINSNKERVQQLNEQIVKIEEKADRYEERLKKQFGNMESVIQKQKAIGGQIKNRFKEPEE